MTNLIHIPLNKLALWEGNVRRTRAKGIDELAASIEAHGLLQSLVVRKDGRKFAVMAGNRRFAALTSLSKAGKIANDFPVPCQIKSAEHATEISLAENTVRENMHPADECDAFRDLIDKGAPVADVAARFGKTETYVQQRLKLARVSPVVIKAYRKGDLTLEQVQAFAVSDDHEAQERVLKDFDAQRDDAADIRASLTEDEVTASDRRVKYVTLKAYEKAGGGVRRDLFSDNDDNVFILDVDLLDRLVQEKLARAAKSVAKEGWKWVEVREEFDYRDKAKFTVMREELTPLSPNKQAALDELQKEYDDLDAAYAQADETACEEIGESMDEVSERLRNLSEERQEFWPPETLAIAGAVICLDYQGKTEITRGLMRPEDAPKKSVKKMSSDAPQTAEGEEAEDDVNDVRAEFTAGLVRDLTKHRSTAITAELMQRPDIVLAAFVHSMALKIIGDRQSRNTCLDLSLGHHVFSSGSKAADQIKSAGAKWADMIPAEPEDLWTWCLAQEQSVLLELMAFCIAPSVDAVMRADGPESGRFRHAGMLATALGLDMRNWFAPTAENYFSRVSKGQMLEAIQEAKGQPPAPAWEKLKKGELVKVAERETSGTGWLPKLLR